MITVGLVNERLTDLPLEVFLSMKCNLRENVGKKGRTGVTEVSQGFPCGQIAIHPPTEQNMGRVMSDAKSKNAGQVRSLTRALSLLRHLADSNDGMSLTELSEAAGLPPSTTHRLLTTLEAERFVRPNGSTGLWQVGVSAFIVGASFARNRDRLTLIRPYLKRLMEITGETANLFVRNDADAVCIGQIESRHAMRAITGVGGSVGLHCSAAGKVMIAFLEQPHRGRLIASLAMPKITSASIVDTQSFAREIDHVRALGYACDDEEHEIGLRCVAAPIFDEHGSVIAAISVSGPAARLPRERMANLGNTISTAALEATREFGGVNPAVSDTPKIAASAANDNRATV
jgi:IclR family acetate operon transcriptional repressor